MIQWSGQFTSKSLKLYTEYLKITHACKVDSNGDNGYEISEKRKQTHCQYDHEEVYL